MPDLIRAVSCRECKLIPSDFLSQFRLTIGDPGQVTLKLWHLVVVLQKTSQLSGLDVFSPLTLTPIIRICTSYFSDLRSYFFKSRLLMFCWMRRSFTARRFLVWRFREVGTRQRCELRRRYDTSIKLNRLQSQPDVLLTWTFLAGVL